MFKCEYGHLFENPKILYEEHDELDESPSEEVPVCPQCGTEEFVEAVKCECGEWTEDADYGLCENCKRELRKDADAFVMGFLPKEKVYVLEYLEVS